MDVVTHALSGAVVGAGFAVEFNHHAFELTILGLLAGMLPDLDFLAEFKGKEAAWKLHRILLHGIVPAFLLGAVLVVLAGIVIPVSSAVLAAVVYSAIIVHLFLDVLTSFGTCLFYPFSKYRVSLKSHFIVDPVVLLVCVWALAENLPVPGLVILCSYFVLSWVLKAAALSYVTFQVPDKLEYSSITLEPAFLAPLRWLVILKTQENYVFAKLNCFRLQKWHYVEIGDLTLRPLALQNGLMRAVLDTFEFPVFRNATINGESMFFVEDVKWWIERPFRPLAFQAFISTGINHAQSLKDIKQGGFLVRESQDHVFLQPPEPYDSSR